MDQTAIKLLHEAVRNTARTADKIGESMKDVLKGLR